MNLTRIFSFYIACLTVTAVASATVAAGPGDIKSEAIAQAESLKPLIDEIAVELWQISEIALKESRSAELLIAKLRAAEFQVETPIAGMETAFIATYGSGSPVIGILAEYDALPGVGNQALPKRAARTDGVTAGHGCGHNLFGAASVGGAIALKEVLQRNNLSGTVKLFGTPAEEIVVGKVLMAQAGVFDGLDGVIDWHPSIETEVKNQAGRAMNNFEVEFFGQAAHGAFDPWNGRSALDAVELMNYGVNMMREHIKPSARIHYVIPNGGDAPNVVPEYAKVWYFVRDFNREEVGKYYQRILKIAEGAALATETSHRVKLVTGVHEYLLNRPLQEAMQINLELVGTPDFDETEQQFAHTLQNETGKEEKGYDEELQPLQAEPEPQEGGSTDSAEASWIAPTVSFSVTTAANGVPWHSWATTACHGTTAGRKGALVAARAIAAMGIDMLTRPELLQAARKFHDQATGGKPYVSPLASENTTTAK